MEQYLFFSFFDPRIKDDLINVIDKDGLTMKSIDNVFN